MILAPSGPAKTPLNIGTAHWLNAAPLQRVFDCLNADGGAVRVVGGAVRNTLLEQPVSDVDLATTWQPEEVMQRARDHGFAVHPTGIDHGTVTLARDGAAFEVTTLREDIRTDGRHAVVRFTNDWARDASRRDFTINALYADRQGDVYDYVGGRADIVDRQIRFIGLAEDRITEDVLRILRFFRFSAWYGRGLLDREGLTASIAARDKLKDLSGERMGAEVLKLLSAPRSAHVVAVMAETGILTSSIGLASEPRALTQLETIERHLKVTPDPLVRLATLFIDDPNAPGVSETVSALSKRLRLSNAESRVIASVAHATPPTPTEADADDVTTALYKFGRDTVVRQTLYLWAQSNSAADDPAWSERFRLARTSPVPELPITGADIVARGVPEGPRVGIILKAFEAWWCSAGFPDDDDSVQRQLAELCSQG